MSNLKETRQGRTCFAVEPQSACAPVFILIFRQFKMKSRKIIFSPELGKVLGVDQHLGAAPKC